ncbi:hypothetical protein ACHAPF_001135 [Botrytis cinerea]
MQLPSPEILASWPIPNYDNPETRGLYTRLGMSKTFGLDDWLILAAMVPSTAFAILAILANRKFHFNRHVWDVPLTEVTFGLQYVIITQIVFTLAQTLTKCSMLALYYRILSSGQKFKIITIAAAIIIAIQGLIFIIVTIFQCRPPSHYWLITFAPQPECINETVHVTVAGVINTVTDFIVVVFPIPKMLQLQMSRRQRIIIIVLFGAGFLVCVAGAVRSYYTYVELVSPDITWNTYYVWISGTVELYVGIIGASIPATKPFFTRYIPFILPRSLHSSRSEQYAISSSVDKGPFSGSTPIATPGSSRKSQTPSHVDLELGDIREREMRSTRRSRNLDAIEEIGSDASISSFLRMAAEGERRSSDECRNDEIRTGKRDSETRPRSEDAFHYATDSKDESIDGGDLGTPSQGILLRFRNTKIDAAGFDAIVRDAFIALDQEKCQFIYQLSRATAVRNIVEVGTSLGVSTIYLALAVARNLEIAGGGESHCYGERKWKGGESKGVLDGSGRGVFWTPVALPALKILEPRMRKGAVVIVDNIVDSAEGYADLLAHLKEPANGYTLPYDRGLQMSIEF